MKILVIDDHVLIREALRGVLAELKDAVSVLEACDYHQAKPLIEQHADLNLVLLDLNLPDRDGFSVLTELRERYPAISVVVLSALQDRASVTRALDLGALGFIPKTTEREIILGALRLVFSGGVYIPAEILSREELPSTPNPSADDLTQLRSIDLGLTTRQTEVLALMALGRTNKAISRTLNMAEPTVKNHITAILKALKVSNRTEAVITASKLGLKLPPVDKS
jgi:Response regulator containing a CheY-like receiver domain and an HTH DNA-binding domain